MLKAQNRDELADKIAWWTDVVIGVKCSVLQNRDAVRNENRYNEYARGRIADAC